MTHVVIHNYAPKKRRTKDAAPAEVEKYYQSLRRMERSELERTVGGRLDPSHLRSESKPNLVNAALNSRFSRRDIEVWSAAHERF